MLKKFFSQLACIKIWFKFFVKRKEERSISIKYFWVAFNCSIVFSNFNRVFCNSFWVVASAAFVVFSSSWVVAWLALEISNSTFWQPILLLLNSIRIVLNAIGLSYLECWNWFAFATTIEYESCWKQLCVHSFRTSNSKRKIRNNLKCINHILTWMTKNFIRTLNSHPELLKIHSISSYKHFVFWCFPIWNIQ